MQEKLFSLIQDIVRRAPLEWVMAASKKLRECPKDAVVEGLLLHLPVTNNADISFLMQEIMKNVERVMSWEALSWVLETTAKAYHRWQAEQQIELMLTGPMTSGGISVRRIDQVLYDMVQAARTKVVLVTFAASRIKHLTKALVAAQQRGVNIKLILEFEQSSEGQLTFDALKAFPKELIGAVDVYCWPVEKRERNQSGKPGKLHAKVALIDDAVIISSANLTDDAFNRNLEMGVKLRGGSLPVVISEYFDGLCRAGVFVPVYI